MNQINFSVRGFYKIGFFNMFVKGRIYNSFHLMSKQDQGTFAHEYIHYLQNITTLSGLRFSSYYIDFIIRLVKWLREQDKIEVPINIEKVITEGSLRDNFNFFQSISGSIVSFDFDLQQDIYWKFLPNNGNEEVHLKIKDINGTCRNVVLGIHAIKESMATLYQSLFDEESVKEHYTYPYHTVKYIAYHLFPNLINDTRKLICICQIALNSPSPARDLLKWLLFASENQDKTGLELYNLHLEDHYYSFADDCNSKLNKHTIQELLKYSNEKLNRKLDKILLSKNKNYKNILSSIDNIEDIHLRILYFDEDNLISSMERVIAICGAPFIYNDYGERMHTSQRNIKNVKSNYELDEDVSFILSLCCMTTSFIHPKENCSSRCIFRTMYCNHIFSQDELNNHLYCADQPWKENGCNYSSILEMLGIDYNKISLK